MPRDVFDQPALAGLMRDLATRKVRLVEVETSAPSPFARSLLFGYVGAFLYEGDAPLAERRAAALALDSTLLGELLGRVDLQELLDPAVLTETDRQLRWLAEQRRPRDAEDVVELLRVLGDLSDAELTERGVSEAWLDELEATRRVLRVRIAGEQRWVGVEDAARLRDALGVALPMGVAEAYLAPVADPLGDLVARYARTHGPFAAASCAARFGLGVFVVEQALRRLGATGRVVSGEFTRIRPAPSGATPRCYGCCAAAHSRRCAGRSSRCRPGRWRRSCPAGSRSARPPEVWRRSPPLWSSCRALRCRRPPWSGWCCPHGSRTTPRPARRAVREQCSGPGRARSPGATAGSPWRTRTPRRCCFRRPTRR